MKADKEFIDALGTYRREQTLVRFHVLDKLAEILASKHIHVRDRSIEVLIKYIRKELK